MHASPRSVVRVLKSRLASVHHFLRIKHVWKTDELAYQNLAPPCLSSAPNTKVHPMSISGVGAALGLRALDNLPSSMPRNHQSSTAASTRATAWNKLKHFAQEDRSRRTPLTLHTRAKILEEILVSGARQVRGGQDLAISRPASGQSLVLLV